MDTQKVTEACHRIESLYYETHGKCYVSFSGGKDSTVLLALIKLCEEIYTIPQGSIPAVFSNTGIELGVTVDFVKWVRDSKWYSNVQIIRPDTSFDAVLTKEGKPILSKLKSGYLNRWHRGVRTRTVYQNMIDGKTNSGRRTWKLKLADKDMHILNDDFPIKISEKCCKYLKKKPFEKYVTETQQGGVLTGLRAGEGGARELNTTVRVKNGGQPCTSINKDGFIKKSPLIDMTMSQTATKHQCTGSKMSTLLKT